MAHKIPRGGKLVIRDGHRHRDCGHSSVPRNNRGVGNGRHEEHRGDSLRTHRGVRVRATHHDEALRDGVHATLRGGVHAILRDGAHAILRGVAHATLHDGVHAILHIHRGRVRTYNH